MREEEIMSLPVLSRDPGNYEATSTVSRKANGRNYWSKLESGVGEKCLTGKYEDLNLNPKIDAGHNAIHL